MSDDGNDNGGNGAAPGRDHKGRFGPGNPGGPGRPRGASITAALRRLCDPDKIAAFLIDLATNPHHSTKERLTASELILDRLEGKARQSLDVTANTGSSVLPPGWAQMSVSERRAWLDRVQPLALGDGS